MEEPHCRGHDVGFHGGLRVLAGLAGEALALALAEEGHPNEHRDQALNRQPQLGFVERDLRRQRLRSRADHLAHEAILPLGVQLTPKGVGDQPELDQGLLGLDEPIERADGVLDQTRDAAVRTARGVSQQLAPERAEPLVVAVQAGLEQPSLVVEVVLQGAEADVGPFGDPPHRDAVAGYGRANLVPGSREDALVGLRGIGVGRAGHGALYCEWARVFPSRSVTDSAIQRTGGAVRTTCMTKLKTLLLALSLTTLAPLGAPARADLACHEGGKVAESTNGRVEVHSSPYGCRQFPSAQLTVKVGGTDLYTTSDVGGFETIYVSDTGRTLLLTSETLRGDRDAVVAYRDGYQLGVYTMADLLGATSRTVTEGRYVKVRIEGLELVIDDVDGTELDRRYVGALPFNRAQLP